jgi:hypothetical protein
VETPVLHWSFPHKTLPAPAFTPPPPAAEDLNPDGAVGSSIITAHEVLGCCLCSIDEMLIHFSLVSDRWMTTHTPPLELMGGSVVTGCTAPGFPPCSGTCCTASATRGFPRTMAAHTVSSGWALQGPCGHYDSPHQSDHDSLVYHGSGRRPRQHSGEGCPPGPHGVL